MIDPATGMKHGERYRVENLERTHQFPGFFLDGKYYLGPELLTAVGWLEGQRFIYDSLDAQGEPIFPERYAGDVQDLNLTLVDGTLLGLTREEVIAPMPEEKPQRQHRQPQGPNVANWLFSAAMLVIGGCAVAALRRGRR